MQINQNKYAELLNFALSGWPYNILYVQTSWNIPSKTFATYIHFPEICTHRSKLMQHCCLM